MDIEEKAQKKNSKSEKLIEILRSVSNGKPTMTPLLLLSLLFASAVFAAVDRDDAIQHRQKVSKQASAKQIMIMQDGDGLVSKTDGDHLIIA
ncbi:unnamed protein product [Enterobius vermicularis]|uniref:Secreted protein n=1 Tax=Enterobius vermicularis TaxID=51028 RepID=A0A0N4V2S8_ENTVE|nr:unnamed protein product [Enterobius vermicularis]